MLSHKPPEFRQLFTNGHAYQYASSSFIDSYHENVGDEIRGVYGKALQVVFQAATAFAGLAFLLALFEKELPLRTELETEYGLKESKSKVPSTTKNFDATMIVGEGEREMSSENSTT